MSRIIDKEKIAKFPQYFPAKWTGIVKPENDEPATSGFLITAANISEMRSPKLVHPEPLQNLLRPFLIVMKIFGLYHMSEEALSPDGHYNVKEVMAWSIQKVMSVVVISYCWIVVAVNVYHLPLDDFDFDANTFTCVVYLTWFLQNAISVSIYFRNSTNRKMLKKFFKTWSAILVTEKVAIKIRARAIRAQWIILVSGILFIIFVSVVFVEIFFVHAEFQSEISEEADKGQDQIDLQVFGIMALLSIPFWVFSVTFFVLVCAVVNGAFSSFQKHVSQIVKSNRSHLQVETIRAQYEGLCDMAHHADCIFSFLIFTYFFNYLLLLCLISYEFISVTSALEVKLIRGFWVVVALASIVSICISASVIIETANKPLGTLYKLDLTSTTGSNDVQLLTFLMRLNGYPIGFTAWGMFVVSRETIMSIASVYMTYLLILVQLKPNANPSHAQLNHTLLRYHRNCTK